MKNNCFKFSVIIPIYNAEIYLDETIQSVIEQTIGFKENIQLILVDDGSNDGSVEICKKYKANYPDNIVFVEKENGGVSSTRNKGLEYVQGKYVNFLDSDDKWDLNAFESAYNFLEQNFEEIDVVSCRMCRFDAKNKFHPTDYKYKNGTRIADLTTPEEIYSVQLSASNVFIKASAIEENRFDLTVKFGEDSLFINKIILKKMKYGILNDVIYYYRLRQNLSSAVQTQLYDKSFYIDTVDKYHIGLAEYCKKTYGKVYKYIQAVIAYDIGFRVTTTAYKEVLSKEEQEEYFKKLSIAYSNVKDKIIINHPVHKNIYKKLAALRIKHGNNPIKELEYRKSPRGLYYKDERFTKNITAYIQNFKIENNTFYFEALISKWVFEATKEPVSMYVKFGKYTCVPELVEYPNTIVATENGEIKSQYAFKVALPFKLKKGKTKNLMLIINYGDQHTKMHLKYNKFLTSAAAFEKSYLKFGRYFIRFYGRKIEVLSAENSLKTHFAYEYHLWKGLKNYDGPVIYDGPNIDEEIKNGVKHIITIRKKYWIHKLLNRSKKKIWYISDRIDNAGDNGNVFFKYLSEHKPKNVKPVFVIGKDYKGIKNLKKYGKVVFAEEEKSLIYFLLADKVISSGASEFTINPFGVYKPFVQDLYKFKYYYLQHGIACADLSSWLCRYKKKIDMFFTSSKKERESILNGNYGYNEDEVVLTGMARFDELTNKPEKYILILPTWRRSITSSYDKNTRSVYYDGFRSTDYFKFYNSLINDERLLEVMRKKGYKGKFCLHPIHMKQYVDFEGNDVFSINEGFVNYNDEFEKAAVMVTDYSSVLFDFTYLRKPVVYSQFDKKQFFENQIYDEGYFQYERDGFGPVCYDLDSTVNELIKLIENDCKSELKYRQRMDEFYAFSDQNNCKRILQAILNGDK